jgi:hypothetical protein
MTMAGLKKHLKAAREVNPLNDWFLARMVAIMFIYMCALVTIIKNWN